MKKLAAILELSRSNPMILHCVCALKTLEKLQSMIENFFKDHKMQHLSLFLNALTMNIRDEKGRIQDALNFNSGRAVVEEKMRGMTPSSKLDLLEQAKLAGYNKQEIKLIEDFLYSMRENKEGLDCVKYRINTNIRTVAEMKLKVPNSYRVNDCPQRSAESKQVQIPESPEPSAQ
jgi:hypothetical protein